MGKMMFSIFKKAKEFLSGTGIGKLPLVSRVYNLLYQYLKPKGIILVEVQGHKMFVDSQDVGVTPDLLMNGCYEKYETTVFKKIVKEGMTVVDIGAHIGYYTLLAANLVGESGRVYAFEPDPNNYALLVKNIRSNSYNNVVPVQKAVSNNVGTTKLFLSPENTGDHRIYNSHDERYSIEIETVTLDEYLKDKENRIDMIKMDIQGAEMAALQGMMEILNKNDDIKIFTEFSPALLERFGHSPEECLNELIKYGFKFFEIGHQEEAMPIDINSLMQMCAGEEHTNLLCLKEK